MQTFYLTCVCWFFLMNMLVIIKPPLFGDPGVKYEYKVVFLQIGSGLSQHYLYYNLSQPVHFQKIVWYYAILGLFCYAYSIHSSLFLILDNSTWLLNIVTGANSVFSWKASLQFIFLCLEYSLIYLHKKDPRSHGTGSLYNMETLLWKMRRSYKHEASQLSLCRTRETKQLWDFCLPSFVGNPLPSPLTLLCSMKLPSFVWIIKKGHCIWIGIKLYL